MATRALTEQEMSEYASGVSGKAVANLIFTFVYLDIERPNMFDLWVSLCCRI
jgi:hypothetical protein